MEGGSKLCLDAVVLGQSDEQERRRESRMMCLVASDHSNELFAHHDTSVLWRIAEPRAYTSEQAAVLEERWREWGITRGRAYASHYVPGSRSPS